MTGITVRIAWPCECPQMLRRRWPILSKVLIASAVVLGALAFVVVRGYQDQVEASHPAVGPPVAIVTAATDLARGTVLSAEMLDPTFVPKEFVPPGAIADGASVLGGVLTSDISAGEILTRSRLAGPRVGPVAALVPAGLRAVVVPSDMPQETLRAGDRVEIYATYGGGRPHTELVASDLEVIRILDAGANDTGLGATTAATGIALVLLVDADAAARLAYARAFGQLQVAIVGASPAG